MYMYIYIYILESSGGALRAPPWFSRMLVPITWYQILGTRFLVPSTWYQVPSAWYKVLETRYLVRNCPQISSNVLVMNPFTVRDQDNILPFRCTVFRCASFWVTRKYYKFTDFSKSIKNVIFWCFCLTECPRQASKYKVLGSWRSFRTSETCRSIFDIHFGLKCV